MSRAAPTYFSPAEWDRKAPCVAIAERRAPSAELASEPGYASNGPSSWSDARHLDGTCSPPRTDPTPPSSRNNPATAPGALAPSLRRSQLTRITQRQGPRLGIDNDRIHKPPQTGAAVIHKFSVRKRRPSTTEASLNRLRRSLGFDDLTVWREYYIETPEQLDQSHLTTIAESLSDGVTTDVGIDEPLIHGQMVQVAHRVGIIDNESHSIITICATLGIVACAGKVATVYCSKAPRLADTIRKHFCNPNIEDLFESEPDYQTLVPAGGYAPPRVFDLLALQSDELAQLGRANGRNLSPGQMKQIQTIQQAIDAPGVSDVLLEALDARWSDHCMHTTWRSYGDLLSRLIAASISTGNPNIVSMFHDNAGVWDFYDGWAIAVKAETHNGPSAVSGYFGQLTKLGGVLRDILGTGLGADPIGCFEYTATGMPTSSSPIRSHPAPREIALDTIRAIKEYGNTFGVPMMSSHMTFDNVYRAKPFALGGSIGLIPKEYAQRGHPRSGDMVLLIGGLTGNEGIHGASASSPGATIDIGAVQIGSPLEEVKFRKAIIEMRDATCIRAITDLGGAGLNSAVGEMGESCGVWINTALVPLKTSSLPMWAILLSESQERMLLAVPADMLTSAQNILERHSVRGAVIGRFTSNGHYHVFHDTTMDESTAVHIPPGESPPPGGDFGFNIPFSLLAYEPPARTAGTPQASSPPVPSWPPYRDLDLRLVLRSVLSDSEIASQAFADSQYDSTVQGNTAWGPQYGSTYRVPTGYWAATPIEGSAAAVVLSTSFNSSLYALNPFTALRQMFCSLLGRLVLAGVALEDIAICDNFYTPDRSSDEGYWLVTMVDELSALVRTFGTPLISGKDSSAGSTDTDEGLLHVPPAVFFTGLGKIRDVESLVTEEWQRPEHVLVKIGPTFSSVAGTVLDRVVRRPSQGELDPISHEQYREYLRSLENVTGSFASGTMIGSGGLLASVCLSALGSGLGVSLTPDEATTEWLFAEHRCGAIVEVTAAQVESIPRVLDPVVIGHLQHRAGVWLNGENLLGDDAIRSWSISFEEAMR